MPALKQNPHSTHNFAAFMMPFTPARHFKKNPRILTGANGMHYTSDDGRQLLDVMSGLWCVNAGHNHPTITAAIKAQADNYDYTPAFLFTNPLAIETATRLCDVMPKDINHVFFTNSGSESVDTALKIAIAYNHARGKTDKVKIISRARGYHGVNFGGMSVGGIAGNKSAFTTHLIPHVLYLPDTHNIKEQAFSTGQPAWGTHLANPLEDMIKEHGADTIAAVIIEPVAGSTGILPPPQGYLEKLRAICDANDILLIFDEVITAFGRLGKTTAAEYFDVLPDILTTAKGINSGAVPMGATFMRAHIHDTLMQGPEYALEFAHGYTYSAHPLACASALAAQEAYKEDQMFENAAKMEHIFATALHSLKDAPHVIDIRTIGLMGGVELAPGARNAENEMSRAMETFNKLYWEKNIVGRFTGNTLAFAPALIINESQINEMVTKLRQVLETVT